METMGIGNCGGEEDSNPDRRFSPYNGLTTAAFSRSARLHAPRLNFGIWYKPLHSESIFAGPIPARKEFGPARRCWRLRVNTAQLFQSAYPRSRPFGS